MRRHRQQPDWPLAGQGEVEFRCVLAHRGGDLYLRAPRQDVAADGAVLVGGLLDPSPDRLAEQVRQPGRPGTVVGGDLPEHLRDQVLGVIVVGHDRHREAVGGGEQARVPGYQAGMRPPADAAVADSEEHAAAHARLHRMPAQHAVAHRLVGVDSPGEPDQVRRRGPQADRAEVGLIPPATRYRFTVMVPPGGYRFHRVRQGLAERARGHSGWSEDQFGHRVGEGQPGELADHLGHDLVPAARIRPGQAGQRVHHDRCRRGSAGQNVEQSGDRLVPGGALAPAAAHAGHVGEQIADGDRRLPLAYPRQPPRRQHLVDVRVQVQAAPGGQPVRGVGGDGLAHRTGLEDRIGRERGSVRGRRPVRLGPDSGGNGEGGREPELGPVRPGATCHNGSVRRRLLPCRHGNPAK